MDRMKSKCLISSRKFQGTDETPEGAESWSGSCCLGKKLQQVILVRCEVGPAPFPVLGLGVPASPVGRGGCRLSPACSCLIFGSYS